MNGEITATVMAITTAVVTFGINVVVVTPPKDWKVSRIQIFLHCLEQGS